MDSAPAPSQKENLKSNFIFEKIDGPNKSMKEFAKMVILLALEEYLIVKNFLIIIFWVK